MDAPFSTVHLQRFADPGAFLERAGPWLVRAEAENNLIIGLATRLREEPGAYGSIPYTAVLERGGEVVGCVLRTPPHKVILTHMPAAALPPIVADLQAVYGLLPAVIGPDDPALGFARLWSAATGTTWSEGRRSRIYQLTRVLPPAQPPAGTLRLAEPADVDLITDWLYAFGEEVDMPTVRARGQAEERVHRREFFLWVDGEPCCMAAWAGETPHSVRIGYVYTPPDRRGRGYASACTAHASQRALDAGYRFCLLFTDVDNPTSNAIYQAIGYQPVCEVADYVFGET